MAKAVCYMPGKSDHWIFLLLENFYEDIEQNVRKGSDFAIITDT